MQTSGNRDYKPVIKWISDVWAVGATFDGLADSGGDSFATLDVKLASSMQAVISHGGHDAKELRDLVVRKMDEAMKSFGLIKGRQIVFLLLENFKTFDNSEVVYGFDHLASCVWGTDLNTVVKQWTTILEIMNGKLSSEAL